MGRDLAAGCPVFAARLAECAAALAPHVEWNLLEVIGEAPGAPGLEAEDVLQPVLWAVSVALAEVWQAAGVVPDAVAGHSQGEIAAATVAGMLSLQDAALVIAARGRVLAGLGVGGGMLSVAASAAQVGEVLAAGDGRVSVAAVNSPAATVVAGDLDALAGFAGVCAGRGWRTRPVPIGYAAHSGQVEAAEGELRAALAGVRPGRGRVAMVSAMTGEPVQGPELDAGYWYASLRAPVQFAAAVTTLAGAGHGVFIEVSPHPVLAAAVTEVLGQDGPGDGPVVSGTLRRGDGGPDRLLAALARAHVQGVPVEWAAMLGAGSIVELPTYAFQRERFWPRPSAAGAGDVAAAGLGAVSHPLLGAAVRVAGGDQVILTGRISAGAQPWLADHVVGGVVLVPGTALLELAVRAGDAVGCGQVAELALQAPLVLPAGGAVQVQVVVGGALEAGARAGRGRPVDLSRPRPAGPGRAARRAGGRGGAGRGGGGGGGVAAGGRGPGRPGGVL
jgi:acyl transferase domain-containing protein